MKNKNGFTLIEVMVVIIMIGILAAIAIPLYSGYIYRARTSEGVVTLGAVKTFAQETRMSRGKWPVKNEIMDQFDNFKDLYYFTKDITVKYDSGGEKGLRIALRLLPSDNFDVPDFANKWIQVDLDMTPGGSEENIGWSGDIKTEFARHLPPCTAPLN